MDNMDGSEKMTEEEREETLQQNYALMGNMSFLLPDKEWEGVRIPTPGVYRHFRNRKYYRLLFLAKHSESGEMLCIYIPLYPEGQEYLQVAQTMARPMKMWQEYVEWDQDFADQINGGSTRGRRFKRVGD